MTDKKGDEPRAVGEGGVTCRVMTGGRIGLDDEVEVLVSPPEHKIRLPG